MTSIRNNDELRFSPSTAGIDGGERGSATILMMLMAGVILTVGLGFNWLVKEHLKTSEGLKNKAEAILQARSAYDTLIYLMLNGQTSQKEMMLSGIQDLTALKSIPLNGKEVQLADGLFISVQESNGLLSLTTPDSTALERLIKKVGGVENTAIGAESFLDWVDPDDFSRVNGAEAAYYRSRQAPYQARNFAVQYKEEIAFVRGIGPDVYAKIEPYLTILPSTGFNPNTAGDEVLKSYLNLEDEALVMLKEFISKGSLSSEATLFFLTGRRLRTSLEEAHFHPSRFMDVTVRAGSPRSLYTIKAGLNFINAPTAPYSVLYWREE